MVEYGKHALDWCSNNFPGVPYPYQKTTIFRGFAGMEYPMMVNDELAANPTLRDLSPSTRSCTRGSRFTWASTSSGTALWTRAGRRLSNT